MKEEEKVKEKKDKIIPSFTPEGKRRTRKLWMRGRKTGRRDDREIECMKEEEKGKKKKRQDNPLFYTAGEKKRQRNYR